MSLGNRVGEEERNWFRSDRIYNLNNKWYFTTREGDELGPFNNHDGVEKAIRDFVDVIKKEGLFAAEFAVHFRKSLDF